MTAQSRAAQTAVEAGDRIDVPFAGHLGFGALVRRTAAQARKDRLSVHAGNVAYHVSFAIFPTLVSALWLLTALHQTRLVSATLDVTSTALPKAAGAALKQQISGASPTQTSGALTFGALVAALIALWAVVRAFQATMTALNAMYAVEERRPLWRRWLIALALSLTIATLLVAAVIMVLFGAAIARKVADAVGGGSWFGLAWTAVVWPVLMLCVLAAFALAYYFAPDVEQRFRWLRTGTALAALLWLVFTALFSIYINNFAAPTQAYGALAGVAILMIYVYVTAFIFLLGAEMNQVIEINDPRGKNEGERTPGAAGRHAGRQ